MTTAPTDRPTRVDPSAIWRTIRYWTPLGEPTVTGWVETSHDGTVHVSNHRGTNQVSLPAWRVLT